MSSPPRKRKQRQPKVLPFVSSQVMDVNMTAQFLTVSTDTVYALFKKGDLPGRKVGRKWKTTKAAVLRWLENSMISGNNEVPVESQQDTESET